jgi:hypothetical protein
VGTPSVGIAANRRPDGPLGRAAVPACGKASALRRPPLAPTVSRWRPDALPQRRTDRPVFDFGKPAPGQRAPCLRSGIRRPQRGRRRARSRWARTAVVAPFASVACPFDEARSGADVRETEELGPRAGRDARLCRCHRHHAARRPLLTAKTRRARRPAKIGPSCKGRASSRVLAAAIGPQRTQRTQRTLETVRPDGCVVYRPRERLTRASSCDSRPSSVDLGSGEPPINHDHRWARPLRPLRSLR